MPLTGGTTTPGAAAKTSPPYRPSPRVIGLYIAAQASGAASGDRRPSSVGTIERRLSALAWNFAQRGQPMDRADRHIATVLAGIRRTHGRPPEQKEAVLPEDLLAMLAILDLGDLRGLRDRAILPIGFAGGLRRSEIVGLDCGAEQTPDGAGWVEILEKAWWRRCGEKPAGARSKSAAAPRTPPALSPPWRPG
jgi:integrase